MWSGMEPAEGAFNQTYVAIMRDIIERLADRGVYAMLDMHQDCLAGYATYYGVPEWLIDSFPEPTNPHPWPFESIGQWAQNYLTQAVSEHFQCLYNNTSGALDKWAGFWEFTARELGPLPSVIGYDYMNEPWVGDFFSEPSLLLPGPAARQNLQPSYDLITEKIRQIDTESITFYEPITYGAIFEGPVVGSGFNRVPGGRQYRNVSAFSWHAYCFNLDILPPDTPDENRTQAVENCAEKLLPKFFNTTMDTIGKTGGAAILSEFGLCKTGDGDAINIRCERFLELADEYIHSWTEWDHNDNKWYNPDGSWKWEKIEPHVRTYAQATAGVPTYMNFNNDNLDFDFAYTVDPEISQPTEIFVPSLRYTEGYEVEVSDDLAYVEDGDMLFVYYEGNGSDNLDAFVRITAV